MSLPALCAQARVRDLVGVVPHSGHIGNLRAHAKLMFPDYLRLPRRPSVSY
ncbi:MAG: hypothetical protein QGD96_02695 [Anaerolineae bacterium]|nr:hypothetical protein [Anaerolineae bacterium]